MKALISLCLRRPVTVTAFYVLVMVLSAVAYVRLPVALLPDLRYPGLVVWTAYPDVPPDRVERAVTERIEEAVAGTAGLLRITSRTLLGGSLVRLDFGWNAPLELALLDVREQIDRLGEALPDEAERPVVLHLDPSERPIMMVALREAADEEPRAEAQGSSPATNTSNATSSTQQPQDLVGLKQIGREVIARRLEQLRDVARVRLTGGYERRIEILIDPARLASYDISLDRIAGALRAANVALPGGMIRRGPFRYAVEVSGEFKTIDDIAASVVLQSGTTPVRLRDVAEVREGVEERRGLVRLDGTETLLLLIERRPDANTVRAAEEVRRVLGELEAELPGVRLDVVVDESVFIEQAIGGVTQAVLLGGLLAILVLFVFLRRVRALVAVAVAVPLSLGLTLVLFDLFEVTFNLISLSGLALGVGMLVDNAIVVVENIARLREAGRSPLEAALGGTVEVAGAITASTLTTIAVFLPITFVEGLAGRLFRDQSMAVVCSLLASLLVALTVVPLLAGRGAGPGITQRTALRTSGLMALYERMLTWSLDHRGRVVTVCVGLLLATGLLVWTLPREVVPKADQGRVEVRLRLPPDADLPLISARSGTLEERLRAQGWATLVLADLGERDEARLDLDPRPPYEGDLVLLLPEQARAEAVIAQVQALDLPDDMTLEARQVQTQLEALLATDEADLLVDLISEDRREAEAVVAQVLRALGARSELAAVRRADAASVPAYRLRLRRDNLARFGVSPARVTAYLEAGARGRHATELRTTNEEIPIVLRARHIDSIERLLAERIPTGQDLLPLGTFVEATFVELPAALRRTEQTSIVRLTADVAPGADLASATEAIEEVFEAVLRAPVRGRVGGASEAFRTSLRAVGWSLLLSLLLVFLILAAQFESLRQPWVILGAVPLAGAGVALVLALTGQAINLMSLTGLVVLVGIVVNDAIIKVDFINQRRAAGQPLREAVLAAGHDRVRPIVMTTITTVLGLLPLALGFGEGAELRAPLAIAIVGGLTSATLLTLLVVPVLYTFVARR
ncbi:MAG: efflux RND transporter permease subunit [Rhodothermales bacterium]